MFGFYRISPVQLSDAGIYTCLARNLAGLAELNFDVQVQGNFQKEPFVIVQYFFCSFLKKIYISVLNLDIYTLFVYVYYLHLDTNVHTFFLTWSEKTCLLHLYLKDTNFSK